MTQLAAPALALAPLLLLASGCYGLLPGLGYGIFGMTLALLLASAPFRAAPARYVPGPMAAGALLFNAIFLLSGVWHNLDARDYLLHLFSLPMFVLAYATLRLHLISVPLHAQADRAPPLVQLVGLVGLVLLLAGQLAQSAGWLWFVKPPVEGFQASLIFRPGGFQNANMTAALALMFLWLFRLHDALRIGRAGAAALALATVVIALTQSRAALLALTLYAIWVFRRHPGKILLSIGVLFVAIWSSGLLEEGAVLLELLQRFGDRFSGDDSSDERAWLLRAALAAIREAPLLGHGYGYLAGRFGFGASHNQVIELLVGFGAIGGLALAFCGALMVLPARALFLLVCVAPTLMFSHNYFESAAFQTALGLALAAERFQRSPVEVAT